MVLPGTKPAGAKTPICWGKLRGGDGSRCRSSIFTGIINCALNGPFIFADWALHIFFVFCLIQSFFFQIKDPKKLSTLPEANGGWTTNFLLGLPFFQGISWFQGGYIYIYILTTSKEHSSDPLAHRCDRRHLLARRQLH